MITHIKPVGSMDLLSQLEVDRLQQTATSDLYLLFRNCSLAVLNSGSRTDSSSEILKAFRSFDISVGQRERGVKLELHNAPEQAFVDGEIIRGIQEHLFSVLRDILYVNSYIEQEPVPKKELSSFLTNQVFSILRNARVIKSDSDPNMVVCWGGHSIRSPEYEYAKAVGHELGLREINICTGCGPGAMEGPMKGATVGHAKQRVKQRRYLGLTEPSIIAAEPPNPIVNELVILPDIEKRLEAFVRLSHGIIIFPGGAGTAEELLYLLGIMMHPENKRQPLPIVLTGPKESEDYFTTIDEFVGLTLGFEAQKYYQIIIDDAASAAQIMKQAMHKTYEYRRAIGDAYSYNWSLKIELDFQMPFIPSHQHMAALNLNLDQAPEVLAMNLRKAFSGIVAGNVKDSGIKSIEKNGPFKLQGDPKLMQLMDNLLKNFIKQNRMKLPGSKYEPCYEIIKPN
ncbi:LOG family protein [Moritella sp. 5]|uniref:nucleotide 5'-monophosphate nucleosidase PpnN n=1 Tax=Moritella sp. 5 TaxID=2746231 RepID=UPI001BAC2A65|nr:nucleotide 5'-monophosphate nucleosidase PpnN [Moritella sp. 5]QUM79305.1 LOG family protein [Moritella sp. 5]